MTRPLSRVRANFLRSIGICRDFITRVDTGPVGARLLARHRLWAYEMALVKASAGWERYLELSLAHYVLGDRAPGGRLYARRRRLEGASLAEIRRTFAGDRDFVDWLKVSSVTNRAEQWLRDGEPFNSALLSAGSALGYAPLIRNASVHSSDDSRDKLRDKTRKLYGSVPRELVPGALLAGKAPPSLGMGAQPTLLFGYLELFERLATRITP